jgi:hypothetical protein
VLFAHLPTARVIGWFDLYSPKHEMERRVILPRALDRLHVQLIHSFILEMIMMRLNAAAV